MKLKDKVAIVTGAGSGIGAETARRMAREGAKVYCADIRGEAAERPRRKSAATPRASSST